MGNTVGSKLFFKTANDFYIMGLWLADGYWRSSSIGLTSINECLINRFTSFLIKKASNSKIKKRIYEVDGISKRKNKAFQIYVNNRPLTRLFMALKQGRLNIPKRYLFAYLAGRIDGDGHVDKKHRSGIRIAYSNINDASRDRNLIGKDNVSLYEYKTARTFVLYLKKNYRDEVLNKLKKFSIKLAP